MLATIEEPRDRIRGEILTLTKRSRALTREIGEAVLAGANLDELRRERQRVREALEDFHSAAVVLDAESGE